MSESVRAVDVLRVFADARSQQRVPAPIEQRLEIHHTGALVASTTRTPDEDEALILGLLFAKGLIELASDVEDVAIVENGTGTVVDVTLTPHRTGTSIGPSRASSPSVFSAAVLASLPDLLRIDQQAAGERSGLHAAALFDPAGRIDGSHAEDVGRRSAVDKLVGRALRAGLRPFADRILFSTGRTSPEVIERASRAGIPIVASMASASTLAIDVASARGITLIGSLRSSSFTVYSHADRVAE